MKKLLEDDKEKAQECDTTIQNRETARRAHDNALQDLRLAETQNDTYRLQLLELRNENNELNT